MAVSEKTLELARDGKGEVAAVRLRGQTYPLHALNGRHYFLAPIPVALVERDEDAQPRAFDPAQAKRIAKSIHEKVLMQPILVRYDETTGKFKVTEGQHRWRAMMDELNEEVIPAIVYVDLDRYTALLCGLEANAEDRARALSGGDIARKTHALMEEFRELLVQEGNNNPSEAQVLARMGKTTRSDQRRFIVGKIAEDIREFQGSKLAPYIADRQSKEKAITVRNLMHFLSQLVRTSAVEDGETNLRGEELANILKVTSLLADTLFEGGKWNPETPDDPAHRHAVNTCRARLFEALGYFIGKVVDMAGGGEASTGACYAPTARINWDKVEREVVRIASDAIWDAPHVALSKKPEDIKKAVADAIR